ncbi:MAG: hypothetical protein J5967_05140 [Oscillospiraceae bacterium]|nr:hypothetical protein [Oscillospiraceae bacterium]
MRERLNTIRESARIADLYGLLALLITLHYLVLFAERYLIWNGHEPLFLALRVLHAALIMLLLLLFVLKLRRGFAPELWLLAAYCAWVLITRVINRDFTLFASLYFSAVCIGIFAAGAYLSPERRRLLLDWLCGAAGGYLFVLSILGLLVWFGGEDAYPGLARFINTNPLFAVQDIEFFQTVHNMSAAWFAVAFFLLAYEWVACKNRLWRIPIAVNMALMLVMISLQHCRSIQVATSVGVGMLAVLAVLPRLQEKAMPVRVGTIVIVAALGLAVCFKGTGLCADVFAKGMQVSQSDVREYEAFQELIKSSEQEAAASDEGAEEAEAVEEAEVAEEAEAVTEQIEGSDARSFLHDALTLTERTNIWQAALRLAKEDRKIALFGQAEEGMMDAVNAHGDYVEVKQHTHNMVIQALVLTGIPGALLLLAFAVLQLVRMVRFYFAPPENAETADKVLVVFLAVLLLYGMAEVLLSRLVGFASLSFLIVSGIFTEIERTAFQK